MPPRKPRQTTTPLEIVTWFRQWLKVREEKNFLSLREKELHHRLCGEIEAEGYRDDKGSLYLDLPEEVEGFSALKYQRSVTKALNEDRAEKLIREKGAWDRCTSLRVRFTDQTAALTLLAQHGLLVMEDEVEAELDQEEILKLVYEGVITQEELDGIFDVTEGYSFRQVKA